MIESGELTIYIYRKRKEKDDMDKIFNAASVTAGIAGGLAAALLGAWDELLWGLVMLMIFDYVTGVIKGIYTKRLSSDTGFKGLLKKVMILVVVALANVVQELTGGNAAIREIVIMFYIANEGISILENAAVLLPNIPEGLKSILLQLRGGEDENRN